MNQGCRFASESSRLSPWFHQYSDPAWYHLWRILSEKGTNLQACYRDKEQHQARHVTPEGIQLLPDEISHCLMGFISLGPLLTCSCTSLNSLRISVFLHNFTTAWCFLLPSVNEKICSLKWVVSPVLSANFRLFPQDPNQSTDRFLVDLSTLRVPPSTQKKTKGKSAKKSRRFR